jgi:hypothetical protein
MGYYSTVTGNIEIKPCVPHKIMVELIKKGFAEDETNKHTLDRDVLVSYDINTEETDQGTLKSYCGWAISPLTDDRYKAYDVLKHVQEIVDFLGTEAYRYLGHLEINGEEQGDLWRIIVKDGKATEIKPSLLWPEY